MLTSIFQRRQNLVPVFYHGFCLSILFLSSLKAQTTLSFEIRPRAEFRNGFKDLRDDNEKPAFFIEQRSRFGLQYEGKKISTSLKLQDVRIWGDAGQINKSDNFLSTHEAWAQYNLNEKFSIRVGRQELVYDDHRILGNLDWAAQGRSHDVIKAVYTDSTGSVHLILGANQNSVVPEPSKLKDNFYNAPGNFSQVGGGLPNYKYMQALWADKNFGKLYSSLLLLNTGWQMPDSTINNLLTVGLNPAYSISKNFKLLTSYYHQLGYDRSDLKTNSYLLSVSLQFANTNLSTTLGFDQLTGTDYEAQNSSTFDPLFGTHHKFYGLMDYFYVGNPHQQNGKTIGLHDFFLRTKFLFSTKSSLTAELHHFESNVPVINPNLSTDNLSRSLGDEIDLVFQYVPIKDFTLHLGYSQIFATKNLGLIKGADASNLNQWAWLMLTFKPDFLIGSFQK